MTKDKVDKFSTSSADKYAKYPKLEPFIRSELTMLQQRLQDLLQTARNYRVTIDSSASYFKMLDEVRS